MPTPEQKKKLLKAKIAVALHDELGRVPKTEEIEQVFLMARVMYKAVLGLHFPHSTRFSGKEYHCSSKASRREDLQVEEPVACRDCASFDFHPTLASVLGPTLIGHQVVEVRQPREKHLLAPFGVMEAFHREQLPLDGVMGLIQQGAGGGHLRVCEHRIPPGFLLLEPAPDALAIDRPRRVG